MLPPVKTGEATIFIDTKKLPSYLAQKYPEFTIFSNSALNLNDNLARAQADTQAIFDDFVQYELFQIVKRNIQEGKSHSCFEYNLEDTGEDYPAKMALFSYTADIAYCFKVIRDEFLKQMSIFCQNEYHRLPTKEDSKAFITINTAKLISYFEEKNDDMNIFPEADWESDYTYNVFSNFVFDELPWIIKRNKEGFLLTSTINFSLEDTGEDYPAKMALFKYQSETNTYCARVKKDEFMEYMLHMPFIRRYLYPTKDGTVVIQIDTKAMEDYYLEEIQREEYTR